MIENLDPDSSSASETKAGENDTLPPGGLVIADRFHILPINSKVEVEGDLVPIRLLLSGKSGGWGTGTLQLLPIFYFVVLSVFSCLSRVSFKFTRCSSNHRTLFELAS